MEIIYDKENKVFNLVGDNNENMGHLEYMLSRRGVLFARKTVVEENYRGQGLGKPMVDAMVDFARQNNYKIRPVCKYVKALFEKYPEKYGDVIYPDDLEEPDID